MNGTDEGVHLLPEAMVRPRTAAFAADLEFPAAIEEPVRSSVVEALDEIVAVHGDGWWNEAWRTKVAGLVRELSAQARMTPAHAKRTVLAKMLADLAEEG